MISLIILAAGKSIRMKENKLILKVNGVTLIERVVDTALRSNAAEIVVVVGHEAEKVREKIANLKCKIVVNDRYEHGQSESVKVGLSAISQQADAVMIIPADAALIEASSINKVVDEYRRSKSKIVIASYKHQSGHPILLDRTLFPEISGIDEQTFGLKALINRHRTQVTWVDVGNEGVLIDIDTRQDFDRYFPDAAHSRE